MTPADESFGSSRTQSIENRQANERKLKVLMLVDQRMAIRLMRLDGDGRRAPYIQVYLSV